MTDTTDTKPDARQGKTGPKEKRKTKASQVEAMLAPLRNLVLSMLPRSALPAAPTILSVTIYATKSNLACLFRQR